MSDGVSFSSRESLKKSLTVARKSAENGGFKLKNYKSSETGGGAASKATTANNNNNNGTVTSQNSVPQPTQQQRSGGLNSTGMKLRDLVVCNYFIFVIIDNTLRFDYLISNNTLRFDLFNIEQFLCVKTSFVKKKLQD